jgi:hypothetical protein
MEEVSSEEIISGNKNRLGLMLLSVRIQMSYFYVYKLLLSTIYALLIKG